MREEFETRIIVREIKPIAPVSGSRAGQSELKEVFAIKEDGEQISMPLRTFENLPLDEPVDVICKLYHHARYGDSYTIKLKREGGKKGGGAGGLGKSVDDLRARVEKLELRLDDLITRLPSDQRPPGLPAQEVPRV